MSEDAGATGNTERWIHFTFGDAFPESSPLPNWVAGLALVSNDLVHTNDHLLSLYERTDGDHSPEISYYFWLTCSHFREAAKLLGDALDQDEISEFVAGLSKTAKKRLSEVRETFEPWEGSFVKRVAGPLRNSFFHYPKPDDPDWDGVWLLLKERAGGLRTRGPSVRKTRWVFADDIRVNLMLRHLGGGMDEVSDSVGILGHAIGNLAVFTQEVVVAYLNERPEGTVQLGKPSRADEDKRAPMDEDSE